jgi:hypothetical protein
MKTISEKKKILALSYYDGVIEGFIDGLWDSNIYFFKVVAWDQNQDQRLYLLGIVERDIFFELLEILTTSQASSQGPIWLPSWELLTTEMTARVNEITAIGNSSLLSPSALALGKDLFRAKKIESPTLFGLASAVALAREGTPGDLSKWQAKSK